MEEGQEHRHLSGRTGGAPFNVVFLTHGLRCMRCSDNPKLSGQIQNCMDSRKVEGNEIIRQKNVTAREGGEYAPSHYWARWMKDGEIMEFMRPDLDKITF